MPQGKLKVKAKIPVGAKVKTRTIAKAKDLQKRNRPALPRKSTDMLRSAVTKHINEFNETTVREKAVFDGKTMHVLPSEDVMPETSKEGKKGEGTAGGKVTATGKKGKGKAKGKGGKGKK